jgi:hypothetical protein
VEAATLVVVAKSVRENADSGVQAAGKCQYYDEITQRECFSTVLSPLSEESGDSHSSQKWKAFNMAGQRASSKRIITHFLGNIPFELSALQQIADALDQGQE